MGEEERTRRNENGARASCRLPGPVAGPKKNLGLREKRSRGFSVNDAVQSPRADAHREDRTMREPAPGVPSREDESVLARTHIRACAHRQVFWLRTSSRRLPAPSIVEG